MDEDLKNVFKWIGLIVGLISLVFLIYPFYNVWASEQGGRAEFARAEYNRRIAVIEAEATKDSASRLAEAEVIRANGVAQANKIIGESLKDNEGYLRYLWINQLEAGQNREVIYIPTEAGIPILEAGNRKSKLEERKQ